MAEVYLIACEDAGHEQNDTVLDKALSPDAALLGAITDAAGVSE